MSDYKFQTGDGESADGKDAIFPLVKQVDGEFRLVGTAFFITDNGIFATAKHNIEDVLDQKGEPIHQLYGFHFLPDNKYIIRPVRWARHSNSDVSVGLLAPAQHNSTKEYLKNRLLTLTTEPPAIGARIVTWAYPESSSHKEENNQTLKFQGKFYEGIMEEYHLEGRDSIAIPYPCYRATLNMLGGASGGPAFDEHSRVFGVNSRAFHGQDIAYFARTDELLPLSLDDVTVQGKQQKITIMELAQLGFILFNPSIC